MVHRSKEGMSIQLDEHPILYLDGAINCSTKSMKIGKVQSSVCVRIRAHVAGDTCASVLLILICNTAPPPCPEGIVSVYASREGQHAPEAGSTCLGLLTGQVSQGHGSCWTI